MYGNPESVNSDLPPAEYGSRHGDTEKCKCGVNFSARVHAEKINATVSWRKAKRGRRGFVCCSISSFSMNSSERGCGNYGCRYSGRRNSRNIGSLFFFFLCVSVSRAWYSRRVVNLIVKAPFRSGTLILSAARGAAIIAFEGGTEMMGLGEAAGHTHFKDFHRRVGQEILRLLHP